MGLVSKKRGKLVLLPFRGKKGDILHEIYLLIFQFVMVFLVALALLQYINNVATDLGFEKRFTSIDIGLLTTTIYSAPGTMKYIYYLPIDFPVPMVFGFQSSLVDIMERGEELHMKYWFLSDHNIDPVDADIDIRASAMAREQQSGDGSFGSVISAVLEDWRAGLVNITYYKSGRQVMFEGSDANPLQVVCPVVNTTDENWQSRNIFMMKVLPNAEDYSNMSLPTNRIVQILDASFNNFQASGSGTQSSGGMGSLTSAIPDTADIVIAIGDGGGLRDLGSLVIYFPVDSNSMAARKFACFLLNDLLTPDTAVYYAQIMPVYTDTLPDDSRLKVFEEKARDDQVMVFLDVEPFSDEQVDAYNTANAIYRAVQRYYGVRDLPMSMDPTFSFTLAGARSRRQTDTLGEQLSPEGAAAMPPGSYGQVMSTEDKSRLLAELARQNNYEYAALKAFFTVESGGSGFRDGLLKIRMEPRVFNERCTSTAGQWTGTKTARDRTISGVSCEGGQTNEHACLESGARSQPDCAYKAVSMGIPQIMGFHHERLGYANAKTMFDDFNRGEEVQIRKFIEFVSQGEQLSQAIRDRNWREMATRYNGAGREEIYAPRLEQAYAAAQQEPLYAQFTAAGAST